MIGIGSDHGGYALKGHLIQFFQENGIEYKDFGCHSAHSVDYPDVALEVCEAILNKECERAILCCGTGIGMSIAANKIRGIRAACCSDAFSAKLTRQHNNANVLCLGERVVGPGLAIMMAELFLATGYDGGRHQQRLDKVADLEDADFCV